MSVQVHSLADVAAAAGVSYRWVRKLVADGKLAVISMPVAKANQHNSRFVVSDRELRRFLADRGIARDREYEDPAALRTSSRKD